MEILVALSIGLNLYSFWYVSLTLFFSGKSGWKCLVLEKKKFPRDKYCGDAVCKTGIEILMDMGIYDQLIKQNKAHVVRDLSHSIQLFLIWAGVGRT